ncbi:uncharacterized protein BXZ73DRAFT_104843 [Epithele typhae]|uniref:uncharacterized protein n=1 Tax=Epithele typhae TaxID=378194 RepID=UPI002008E163|nr:uncharacterized protein BXZ73DRAFT_104843 [Epithele typhae]KAH9920028.1 hypothetical protein BXZ73DRAFT_104843 [Epithele typhae]
MITLSPGSLCDVCAEEYGPHNLPHSIPCGHVLCLACCNNIVKKTPARLAPSCPFCRESFTGDSSRLIRIDFGSGFSTPKRSNTPKRVEALDFDVGEDDVCLLNPASFKGRSEARRLESKVAQVAAKKCSVEEVSTLHKELQDWLRTDKVVDEQSSSLQLSAALLRAILINHVAHSEAARHAKMVETQLVEQLEKADAEKEKMEAELRALRAQYSQKAQEAQSLRVEVNRGKVKSAAPLLGVPTTPPPSTGLTLESGMITPPRPQSVSTASAGSRSGATSPTSPTRTTYTPTFPSPLARPSPSLHSRTTSLQRSMTPQVRSGTPVVSGADIARPATIPPKIRRMSMSSTPTPTKMSRSSSSSDEKEKEKLRADAKQREKDARRVQLIQRWIPPADALSRSPPTGRPEKFESSHSHASRLHHSMMPPLRYKTPVSHASP